MSIAAPEGSRENVRDPEVETGDSTLSLRWYGRPPPRQLIAPMVVTGVFDVLHPGHVRFLTWAAAKGRPLYVGIEDDDRVRHWKGANRPAHPIAERAEVLTALKPVSMVFYILGDPAVCQGEDYVRLLSQIDPGALAFTAGDPYAESKRASATALGIDCWEFPVEVGYSTSDLLGRFGHKVSDKRDGRDGIDSVASGADDEGWRRPPKGSI